MANPVGEDSWVAYLEETTRNAADLEQRVNVVELFKRALGDEPGSLRLWKAYCEYFWTLWESSNSSDDAGWSEEEQMLGREVFSLDAALDLWQQAYEAVQYRLNDSHELWDHWISLETSNFAKNKTSEGVRRITQLYRDRLTTPHLNWDETSQAFSSFLSEYSQPVWEETMKDVTSNAQETKRAIQVRDPFEMKLKQSARRGEADSQRLQLREYLEWELRQTNTKHDSTGMSSRLCAGLFDRALTSFLATDDGVWYDYIVFSSSRSDFQPLPDRLLDISRRSVQHCPWSGRLWSRYILAAEVANLSFEEVEAIKNAAAGDGQLCKDGLESMIEMYGAWCSFLKRTALQLNVTDMAANVVELGLKAAMDDVVATGKRLYGKEFQGDPKYRLEKIYIQYLTEKKGAVEEARTQWRKLERNRLHADSYSFWFDFYTWEMLVFASSRLHRLENAPLGSITDSGPGIPAAATAVLQSASTRKTIDWPERILELYILHCDSYEIPLSVRQANDTVHRAQKVLAHRRKREQEAQAAQYAAYYETQAQAQAQAQAETQVGTEEQSQVEPSTDATASPSGPKRKRESLLDTEDDDAENASKRHRNGLETPSVADPDQVAKRDRENATIIVTNLPFVATQTEVRKYFKPYGHINNITAFVREDESQSTTALIEFGSAEEAQSALLRDAKYFGESQIRVQSGHDLTIYVANYPPAANENFMRLLFKDCGDILSIRWPSLKINTHRRFCYISFRDRDASAKAVAKEGKLLESKYRLLVKYSDPSRKKHREGAIAERREVHISNLDRQVTEADIRDVFGKFGSVKRVNIPQTMAGKNRGFAFVDFETQEQAANAVQELNNTKFRSQILQVEVSKENRVKPSAKTTDLHRQSASPAPPSARDSEGDDAMEEGGAEGNSHTLKPSSSDIASRTIALMGLPDTVNDARVRALVEPLGTIIKLVHQPGHGGAIIEFSDAAVAGRAALQLDSMQYEGHQLRTGPPSELRQAKANHSNNSRQNNQSSEQQQKKHQEGQRGLMAPPQATRRPILGRVGSKRGLGFVPRKAMPVTSTGVAADGSSGSASEVAPKSNADFKAMFLASKDGNKNGDKTE